MKFRKFFSIAVALSLMLTGCNTSVPDEQYSEMTTGDAVSEEVEEENITPVKGGTLRLGMKRPDTLNPLNNKDVTVDSVLKLIFEPLFNIDNNMDLKPNIAESIDISGTTVKIKVKDNLTWADGKAIGADDVIYSLDVIKDAEADTIYKSALANVSDYRQTGDKTLEISYSAPVGAVGYNLAIPIIPKHYYRNNDDGDMTPLGCGSFELEEYKFSKELKLKATNGINGEPYISEIDVLIVKDDDTILDAVENNVIDACSINAENLGEIKGNITGSAKLYTSNQFEYAGFNTSKEIFETADLRKAMAYIMPVEDAIKGIYINNITQSLTPINPDSIYTNMAGVDTYSNDISTANTLILSSGLTKSQFSFTILVNSENKSRCETAKMLSDAFNEYGMNTSVEAVSFEEYQNRLAQRDFDMYLGGTELNPSLNLAALLGSSGAINFTGYADAQMDQYINNVNSAADFTSYEKALNELNKYISVEVPVVGIGFKKKALVFSEKIKGDITPLFNNCYYNINNWFITE